MAAIAISEARNADTSKSVAAQVSAWLCDFDKLNSGDNRQILEWAAALDPTNPRPPNSLGVMAQRERRYSEAARYFTQASEIAPDNPSYLTNAGAAFDSLHDLKRAEALARKALAMNPEHLAGYVQLASVLQQHERHDEVLKAIERGLKIDPTCDDLLFGRALVRLHLGDYEGGWQDFEHRSSRLELAQRLEEYPEWKGEALEGKTILVCGEQGFGDQILFSRFLNPLLSIAGHVVFKTEMELARLFARAFPSIHVVTSDKELNGIEPDYWIGLMSLAKSQIVNTLGAYIIPEVAVTPALSGPLRVGLNWAGNPAQNWESYRRVPFDTFAPLLEIPGIEFGSLQKNDAASQNERIPSLITTCYDVLDTANVIAGLDLVITSDSLIANLAAAMGKPVWVLLGHPSDWRWERGDWYPDARIFRQPRRGDWAGVIGLVREDLIDLDEQIGGKRPATITKRASVNAPPQTKTELCRYGWLTYFADDWLFGRSLHFYGEWSEGEVDLFRRVLKANDVVVDAGANIGAFTVPLLQMGCEVHAFEPQPEVFGVLLDNCPVSNGRFYKWALGCTEGIIALSPFHSINPGDGHVDPEAPPDTQRTARVTTLDSLNLKRLHFLKADVENYELEVLRGAEETIARYRPLLYLEADRPGSTEALSEWMHAHDYRVYRHIIPIFNPDNFRGYKINLFGKIVSAMLLGVPRERYGIHPCDWGLKRINITKVR